MPIFEHHESRGSVHVLTTTQAYAEGRTPPLQFPQKIAIASIGLLAKLQAAGNPQFFLNTGAPKTAQILWHDPNLLLPGINDVCPLILVHIRELSVLPSSLMQDGVKCTRAGAISIPPTLDQNWHNPRTLPGTRFHSLNPNWRFSFNGRAEVQGSSPASFEEGGFVLINQGGNDADVGIVVDISSSTKDGIYVNLQSQRATHAGFNAAYVASCV